MCQAADALRLAPPPRRSARASYGRRAPLRSDAEARLVLLGTAGGSIPKATRCGYAGAVVVGSDAYVVDCGEGVAPQAWRAGIGTNRARTPKGGATIGTICVTHLHSDHVIDLANLLLCLWPDDRVDIYGPGPAGPPITTYPPDREVALPYPEDPTPGLASFVERSLAAHAYNINVRIADEGRPNLLEQIHVHEIGPRRPGYEPAIDLGVIASGRSAAEAAPPMDPVVVLPTDANGVTISAILVQHAPVFPALAYRIDTGGGSVVFSGDTGPCANVARLAQGADILVHEVIDIDSLARRLARLPNRESVVSHLTGAHTPPEEAGRIAAEAGVGTLVLSHLVPGDDEIPEPVWEDRARRHFDGRVVCGVDLDEFALVRTLR